MIEDDGARRWQQAGNHLIDTDVECLVSYTIGLLGYHTLVYVGAL